MEGVGGGNWGWGEQVTPLIEWDNFETSNIKKLGTLHLKIFSVHKEKTT